MKRVLILAAIFLISATGCGSVTVEKDGMKVHTMTLFKSINKAEFAADESGVIATLGSSTSEDTKALAAVCILYPELPACNQ